MIVFDASNFTRKVTVIRDYIPSVYETGEVFDSDLLDKVGVWDVEHWWAPMETPEKVNYTVRM